MIVFPQGITITMVSEVLCPLLQYFIVLCLKMTALIKITSSYKDKAVKCLHCIWHNQFYGRFSHCTLAQCGYKIPRILMWVFSFILYNLKYCLLQISRVMALTKMVRFSSFPFTLAALLKEKSLEEYLERKRPHLQILSSVWSFMCLIWLSKKKSGRKGEKHYASPAVRVSTHLLFQ